MWGLIVKWGAWGASALMGGGEVSRKSEDGRAPPSCPPSVANPTPREW